MIARKNFFFGHATNKTAHGNNNNRNNTSINGLSGSGSGGVAAAAAANVRCGNGMDFDAVVAAVEGQWGIAGSCSSSYRRE